MQTTAKHLSHSFSNALAETAFDFVLGLKIYFIKKYSLKKESIFSFLKLRNHGTIIVVGNKKIKNKKGSI